MTEEQKPDMLDQLIAKQVSRQTLTDKLLDRLMSRKLAVWLVSTYLLLQKVISVEEWQIVTIMFLGAEGATNVVDAVKKKLIK